MIQKIKIAEKFGAEVINFRPKNIHQAMLAQSVIKYEIKKIKKKLKIKNFNLYCIYSTAPLLNN